ncbi:MAG: HD domain-containing protein [Desulfobacteraceae bacterium]|nr:MAG: HD domain-containing protein [Desulfobacteraceae bacterium]
MASSLAAVILAAGFSSRMGAFKPLLPFGDSTVIEEVVRLFSKCGIRTIRVITGHNHHILEDVIRRCGAIPVFNPDYETGMLSSIQAGFRCMDANTDGAFLLPVDIPAIRQFTLQMLMDERKGHEDHIIMPCFQGFTGHPPLIPMTLKDQILALGPDQSLRDLFESDGVRIKTVDTFDRGILMDADDPDGYERIRKKKLGISFPERDECEEILNRFLSGKDHIKAHARQVATAAETIAAALPCILDPRLIVSAALLHDICRDQPQHAQKGAKLVRQFGFDRVADVISHHMDMPGSSPLDHSSEHLTEKEIVYFADKVCKQDRIDLNYHDRFAEKITQYPHKEHQITRRYEIARHIQTRIETLAGQPVDQILG